MERLEIRLLGGFELRRDGRTLDPLPLRAARSLFAFLVLNRERVLTRDLLAGTFWPDFDETRARRRLSQALWQAQKALGEEDGQRYIIGTPDTIRFNAEADVWIDVDEFVGSLDEAADAPSSDEVAALRRAVDMYQGDLLAGFYDDWLFHDQDRIRTRFLGALERLADLAIARGDYETAFEHARRLAQEDEFDEEAHRRVMRVAVLLGRHNEAIKQYEECTRILAEELGAEPSAETVELYEKTLADRDSGTRAVPSHEDSPLFGDVGGSPFIGRESERARLAQRLDDALEGKGRIVLVEGEAGVGKTRLLREVAEDAQWRGMDVVWGRSAPSGGRPFGPIGDALRNGLSELRVRQLQNKLDGSLVALLAPLLPEAGLAGATAVGGAADQALVHEAIWQSFVALSEINPTLVVFEDLHWSDEDTVHALDQLSRNLAGCRLLVAVTYRHGEARESPEAWELLRSLDRLEHAERLSLSTLSPAQTEELIRFSLGKSDISAGFSERLHRETGGVPLFVVETLRAHFELDHLGEVETPVEQEPGATESLPIAPMVRTMMNHRLAGLESTARTALEVAATHDRDLSVSEILRASELASPEGLAVIDDLVGRRLLQPIGEGFAVAHELLRRVVYDGMSLTRRLELHRRLGFAIEHVRPQEAELLAHHFVMARMPEEAIGHLEKAADIAVSAHAYDAAARHLSIADSALEQTSAAAEKRYALAARRERVLDVLARRDEQDYALRQMERYGDSSDRIHVQLRRAWWLVHTNDVSGAQAAATSSLELARQQGEDGPVVEALTALGMISCFGGRAAEGVVWLEEAAGFPGASDKQKSDARAALGKNLIDLQRFEDAKRHLLAALELYRELEDARGEAEVLGTLGTMRLERGEPDGAESDLVEAIEISRRIGYRQGEAFYQMNLGILHVITGRVGAALEAFVLAEEAYVGIASQRGRALVLSNSAWLWHGLVGDDDMAAGQLEQALEIYESTGDERGVAQCQALEGSILGRSGRIAEASSKFAQALERTERLEDHWLTAQALREWGAMELENEAIDAGLKHLARADELCRRYGMNDLLVGVRALTGRLLLRSGEADRALALTTEAMNESRKGVELAHLVPLALGEVHHFLGDEQSAAHFVALAHEQLSGMLADLDPEMRDKSWTHVPNHRTIHDLWMQLARRVVKVRVPRLDAPFGRPLRDEELVEVSLTVNDPADNQVGDAIGRRRQQIVRVLAEAEQQGGAPKIDHIATALSSSVATIRRDLAALRSQGARVPTRGSR